MLSVVQPVFASVNPPLRKVEGRTWKEWGRDMKETADEIGDSTPDTGTEILGIDVKDIMTWTMWAVGATVEYFSDDAPEEKPQPQEEEKSSWWPF